MKPYNIIILIIGILFLKSVELLGQYGFMDPLAIDPFHPEYVNGEVLVKFKDKIQVEIDNKDLVRVSTGIKSIDAFLTKNKVCDIRKVFPNTSHSQQETLYMNDFTGMRYKVPKLHNIYKLIFEETKDAKQMAEWLSQEPAVDYAEPNYYIHSTITIPNDALYQSGEQWYLDEIQAPYAWDSVSGDTSQIIGIIDTGIDWDHPDLDGNIWNNCDEIPGNGIDDDGNGFIDDIRGWDFFNNDNNPDDDNGHGTHVAGISGAETNNYIGIAGVCWNCRLMPLKVLSGTGQGNMADLALAINYASSNGVTVINMSLGAYAESLTVKAALENAYNNCILVAAAGNDHYKIDTITPPQNTYAPHFPSCYSFVIGVEASTSAGQLAGFSNFDPSGFVYSKNPLGYNYEIRAPGVNIFSTFPDGGYFSLTGTSMASPVVAGAVALLKSFIPDISNEDVFARIVQFSQNSILNLPNLLNSTLGNDLVYTDYMLVDTTAGADNDGYPDAGETVDIWFTIKNAGGYADSVWTTISLNYTGDTSLVAITDSLSYIGNLDSASYNNNIPAYTTMTGEEDPFRITLKPGILHGKIIIFNYQLGSKNGLTKSGNFSITIQSGKELSGLLDTTYTITPDKLWVINKSFRIAPSGVLNILPGTHLKIEKPLYNNGIIYGYGNKDSMITIEGPQAITEQGHAYFSYTVFTGMTNPIRYQNLTLQKCSFRNINTNALLHCELDLTDCYFAPDVADAVSWGGGTARRCILDNCGGGFNSGNYQLYYNNFSGDLHVSKCNLTGNNFAAGKTNVVYTTQTAEYDYVLNQYWGTTDSATIDGMIWDFWDNPTLAQVIFQPMLSRPSDSAHGFLWKVLVNGKNPQVEYLDPVGVERVKFEAVFSKPVDTTFTPLLSFGVIAPYTQHIVAEDSYWSTDSSIWTAFYDIDLETGDGINSIRISGAIDTAGLPVPTENNERFQFIIQAASSTATQFLAIPGIGKVYLEWPYEQTDDFLGFNMYRFAMLNDSVSTDTSRINNELISDSTFVDYDVVPDSTYYYCYKIMGTDLQETGFSEIISVTPLSTANGDANGDQQVNVLDITSIISYILEQEPVPFVFEAADMNYDGSINILDVVNLVNLIQNLDYGYPEKHAPAYVDFSGNELLLFTNTELSAVQFRLTGSGLDEAKLSGQIPGFEFSYHATDDNIVGLLYSFNNNIIHDDTVGLFYIESGEGSIEHIQILGSDPYGNPVYFKKYTSKYLALHDELGYKFYPNPISSSSTLSIKIPESLILCVTLYDMKGQKIFEKNDWISNPATYEYQVQNITENGRRLLPGLYYLELKGIPHNKDRKILRSVCNVIVL